MTKVLWTALGAVVAVNVVVLTGAAISLILERRRHKTEIRYLESIWRGERPLIPGRPQTAAPGMPHRTSGRKLAGVVTAVALLCAGTALANPEAVVSVLGTVAEGLHLGPSEPVTSAAGHGEAASIDPTWRTSDLPGAASAAGDEPRPVGPSEDTVEPTPDPTPAAVDLQPAIPTAIAAVQTSVGVVVLSWNDVANETGYRVERSADGLNEWKAITFPSVDVTTTVDDDDLSAGTYYYRVSASNAGGDSAPSVVAGVTVVDPPSSPPTINAVAVSATEILLMWVDVANEAGYQIERSSDGSTGWIQIATPGEGDTEYTDAGLTHGTYYYRVVAVNVAGASSPSDVVAAETLPSESSEPSDSDLDEP